MPRFRKKPVMIEARQMNTYQDAEAIVQWMGGGRLSIEGEKIEIKVHTLEGTMTAILGDFIIQGVNGEFYPCKPDIFEKTYEKAD